MKLLPFFKNVEQNPTNSSSSSSSISSNSSWPPWPSCKPKTLSFRITGEEIKVETVNSGFSDDEGLIKHSDPESSSSHQEDLSEDCIEEMIRGLRSERLLYKPEETNSILEESKVAGVWIPYKESVALSMESRDPYEDFKRSMEEMVEAHGLKDWERLEELLGWFLKVNGKQNHGFILGAFGDLLLDLSASVNNTCGFSNSSSSSSSSPGSVCSLSSPLSLTSSCCTSSMSHYTSPSLRPGDQVVEIDEVEGKNGLSSFVI